MCSYGGGGVEEIYPISYQIQVNAKNNSFRLCSVDVLMMQMIFILPIFLCVPIAPHH